MQKFILLFVLLFSIHVTGQEVQEVKEKVKNAKDKVEEVVDEVKDITSPNYNWNIKTNPLSFLIGATNAEINYAVWKKFSLGFGGLRWSTTILDVEFTATEYHLRGDFWFNDAFKQGWYLGAQISRLGMDLTTEVSGVDFTGSIASTGYLLQLGYHWQWDNFNIDFGSYFGYYDFDSEIQLEDASGNTEDETVPAFGAIGAEFFIGWAF